MLVATIVAAILLSQPGMSRSQAVAYARVLSHETRSTGVDPLGVVALVHNESRWIASTRGGRDGACIGLGQVCLHDQTACRGGFDTPSCQARAAELQDGAANLRVVVRSLVRWRRWCDGKTGPARTGFGHWVVGYGGWNDPGRNQWCGRRLSRRGWVDVALPSTVRRILVRRAQLHQLAAGPRRRDR